MLLIVQYELMMIDEADLPSEAVPERYWAYNFCAMYSG